ncbi:hypothetical protein IMX26_02590 [Clostridium sp. 'deep sea']|uniref:sugar-binding domain-containing protein n=1 Tax=Clostridium sp. 'deep sea' TaxID=2779445 RepID=UPI001896737B|nr:sugar-binding domain-containing protein [Clostridium sp. 'deep sea']QOR35732.1 hypothetical protein IMX26_02590 [Clostridium sp. 'deep sea']
MKNTKLNGLWKAWPSKQGPLPRDFYNKPNIANDWFDIKVPGTWQTQNNFSDDENIVYYFKKFTTPTYTEEQHVLLELNRVFNDAEIWINGKYVTAFSDYFVKFHTTISKYLNDQDNFVFIKVSWPAKSSLNKYEMLGVYSEWEFNNDSVSPGGIGGDINLKIIDDIHINDMSISYEFKELNRVEVTLRVNMYSRSECDVNFDWNMIPLNFDGKDIKGSIKKSLKKGSGYLKLSFSIHNPELWYPWEQGEPNLYKLYIQVIHEENVKDRNNMVIGFRDIYEKNGSIFINQKRQFLRGIVYMPTSYHSENITRESLENDIQLILDAGINTIRLFQHVPTQELYDICNENGLMLWQDIPYNYCNNAKTQNYLLRRTVYIHNTLHHNPSLIIWGKPSKSDTRYLLSNSRKLLGLSKVKKIGKTLKKLDQNRVVVENTRFFSFSKMLYSKITKTAKLEKYHLAKERMSMTKGKLKLISNYGFPAFPEIATMIDLVNDINSVKKISWITYQNNNQIYENRIESNLPLEGFDTAPTFYMATQNFQANLLRYYHELCRRYKYRPYGGCFMYFFADNSLTVSDSIVDVYRRTKQGYTSTKTALQPICVLMDWPDDFYTDGDIIKLNVYVVNDTHNRFPSTILRWKIVSSESETIAENRKIVDMLGDDSLTATTIQKEVTAALTEGTYQVYLELELQTQEILTNRYQLKIKQ